MTDNSRHTDFLEGRDAAREVLDALAPADRADFIADELSDEGKARGREISEQSELYNLGWEHALEEERTARHNAGMEVLAARFAAQDADNEGSK